MTTHDNGGRLYLLNAKIVPLRGDVNEAVVRMRRVSIPQATALLKAGFVSCVGHESTARVLSSLLGVDVPLNRSAAELGPGDRALQATLRCRLAEGEVLSESELQALIDNDQLELVFVSVEAES